MGYRAYKFSRISGEILKYIFTAGTIYAGASSPYFALSISKNLLKGKCKNQNNRRTKRKIENAFTYLKKNGLIEIDKDGFRVRIALTEEGKKKAGRYQINDLKISKPQNWDGKWRVIIFDIPHNLRLQRNVFREKLRELGFYYLQKSAWVYPYDCYGEIKLLRDFFGLREDHIRVIVAVNIGNDQNLKKFFKI